MDKPLPFLHFFNLDTLNIDAASSYVDALNHVFEQIKHQTEISGGAYINAIELLDRIEATNLEVITLMKQRLVNLQRQQEMLKYQIGTPATLQDMKETLREEQDKRNN